jgi:hypothetical protein
VEQGSEITESTFPRILLFHRQGVLYVVYRETLRNSNYICLRFSSILDSPRVKICGSCRLHD